MEGCVGEAAHSGGGFPEDEWGVVWERKAEHVPD